MKKLSLLGAIVVASAAFSAIPTSAQAHWWHHHWHHWSWNNPYAGLPFEYVTVWWDHPTYYWAPYSVVDHVLVHRAFEVGPIPFVPVPVTPVDPF
jgi:hypothetical protein